MKIYNRLLCVMLALLMCLSAGAVAVSAEDEDMNVLYKDIVFDSLGERVGDDYYYRCEYMYNSDGSAVDEGEMPDYILAYISGNVVYDEVVERVIGNYYFYKNSINIPFDLGYCIYSVEENKCYSLDEAWVRQLPNIENILAKLGTPVNNLTYKDIVVEAFGDRIKSEFLKYRYIYSYNEDGSTVDENEIPDYIVGWLNSGGTAWAVVERVIGDYYFTSGCICSPYDLGYFICSTKENRCYSFDDAWELKLPNVETAFAKAGKHIDEVDNKITNYRSKIMTELGWKGATDVIWYECLAEYNADGSETKAGEMADYVLFFAQKGPWNEETVFETIGNYRLNRSKSFDPGLAIYSVKENKIYSLRQAYNENVLNMEKVLENCGTKRTLYAHEFEEYLKPTNAYKELATSWDFNSHPWYSYKEVYYYTDGKGTDKMPEATPDYVLIDGTLNMNSPSFSYGVIGDYVLFCENCGNPDCLGYFVYTPEEGKMRTLKEAYDAGVEGIENVFTDFGLGLLMGDADGDGRLTIKDATYIQKYLAKVEGINPPAGFMGHDALGDGPDGISVADYDINGKVNIKDSTAIQKKLAKIAI